jgi:hypothetical protein
VLFSSDNMKMRTTEDPKQYGRELGNLFEEVEELVDEKDQYVEQVNLFKKDQISTRRLVENMYNVAENLSEIEDDVFPGVEELYSGTASSFCEASATDNELAYQSFVEAYGEPDFVNENLSRGEQLTQIANEIRARYDNITREAEFYESDFLSENLGIEFEGVSFKITEQGFTFGEVLRSIEIEHDKEQAEEIRKNPRDTRNAGLERDGGVENILEAREKVRERDPRGIH